MLIDKLFKANPLDHSLFLIPAKSNQVMQHFHSRISDITVQQTKISRYRSQFKHRNSTQKLESELVLTDGYTVLITLSDHDIMYSIIIKLLTQFKPLTIRYELSITGNHGSLSSSSRGTLLVALFFMGMSCRRLFFSRR